MNFSLINHIAIICSDYQKSKYFYEHILGFKVLRETFRGERNSYKLDLIVNQNTQIELFSFPAPPKRVTNPEALGLRHLAFTVDDIEETVEYLVKRSIAVEPIRFDELTGKRFTFFRDPDDLPLEIYES